MALEMWAFIGSAVASVALAKMRHIQRGDAQPASESKSVVLLLHVPQAGNNPLATIINNDEIIAKVVRGMYTHLTACFYNLYQTMSIAFV